MRARQHGQLRGLRTTVGDEHTDNDADRDDDDDTHTDRYSYPRGMPQMRGTSVTQTSTRSRPQDMPNNASHPNTTKRDNNPQSWST